MSSTPTLPPGSAPPRPGIAGLRNLSNADLELKDIVRILRRRRAIIFTGFILGIILAATWLVFAEREYSATATIEINKEGGNGLGLDDLSGVADELLGGDEMTMDLLTQQAVITSDNTSLLVISRLKLDSIQPYAIPPAKPGKETELDRERGRPLDEAPLQRERILGIFAGRLNVKVVKGTRLMSITYTDTDPLRSTAIANAVVEAYIDEYTQARYQASAKASSWLANQLADLKSKVEDSQAKVDQYQRESGLVGMEIGEVGGGMSRSGRSSGTAVPASENVPMERLIELNRDLTNAEVSRIAKEAIYRMTETQDPDVVIGIGSSALVSGLSSSDSVLAQGSSDLSLLQQLRQQQAQLQVELAAATSKYGAKNPAITQLHNEQSALDAQVRAELVRIRTRAKNDLDLAELAEKGVRERVSAQEGEVNKETTKAGRLILLQQEAISNRELYQDLYSRLEEASVAAGIKASNITLVDPARVPARPSSPRKGMSLALGALIGLVLGTIAAFLWDYFDDSIATPEHVEQITTVPVIGVIPDFMARQGTASKYGFSSKAKQAPVEVQSNAWLIRAPRSQISEAYRTLRTALLMSKAEHPPKVILIMSASPSEGKSTTCFNTAAAFAVQGDRVLYIDADLRRPKANTLFNTPNDVGLSNCLTGGLNYESVLKASTEIDTLFLLAAGPSPPNPSELIGSKRFAELVADARSKFDFVFIDSPPILLVTDAQLITPLTDGYVLILRSGKTTKRALLRALTLLRAAKSTPLGIVVNAVNTNSGAYSGYGYSYGRSSYYVEGKD